MYGFPMKQLLLLPLTIAILLSSGPVQAQKSRKNQAKVAGKVWYVGSTDGKSAFLENGKDRVWAIASLSKLMAMLVVLDAGLKLDEMTTMQDSDWVHAAGGSRTRLKRGIAYSNNDLLHAALLGSDNRAVFALGRAVGLNANALVARMNARARKMAMKKTRFTDATGISHENVSTAGEVAILLKAASENRVLAGIMRTDTYTVVEQPSKRQIVYNNTNIMTRNEKPRVVAGKTGFNSAAGYCVATLLDLPGFGQVAFVLLGSTGMYQRFADLNALRFELQRMKPKQEKKVETPARGAERRKEPAQPKQEVRSRQPASR